MRRALATMVVAFVAVAALVLGAAAVSPAIFGGSADTGASGLENPQYENPDLITDRSPGSADVELTSDESANTVLIDAGQATSDRQLRPLVNALADAGHDVEFHDPLGAGSLDQRLDEVDALLIVGAAGDYDADQAEAVSEFADDGGRVVLATEPAAEFDRADTGALEAELGVYAEPGYAYNLEENDLNYQRVFVEPEGDDVLTEGVDRAVFVTATPVGAADHDTAFHGIEGTTLSTTREATDAPLMLRDGNVAIVGDTFFMEPENVQRADNDVLLGNVGDFLVSGDYETTDDEDGF